MDALRAPAGLLQNDPDAGMRHWLPGNNAVRQKVRMCVCGHRGWLPAVLAAQLSRPCPCSQLVGVVEQTAGQPRLAKAENRSVQGVESKVCGEAWAAEGREGVSGPQLCL